ncbi:hypothetical protein CMV_004012, partial [Castanea mollissima]
GYVELEEDNVGGIGGEQGLGVVGIVLLDGGVAIGLERWSEVSFTITAIYRIRTLTITQDRLVKTKREIVRTKNISTISLSALSRDTINSAVELEVWNLQGDSDSLFGDKKPTKLKVPKPQIDIAFKRCNSEAKNLDDPGDTGEVRMVLLHLHVSLGFKLTCHRLLPESTEQVELSLILDVSQVVLLEQQTHGPRPSKTHTTIKPTAHTHWKPTT